MLSQQRVDLSRLSQIAGPLQTGGVTVGGIVPSPKECMQFEFNIEPGSTTDCIGCTSECKTLHVSSDIKAVLDGVGSPVVVLAAGDYEMTRTGSVLDCEWTYRITDGIWVHFNASGNTGDGHNTAVTFQHAHVVGSLYYANTVEDPDCENFPYVDKYPDWDAHPATVTVTGHACADPGDVPADCSGGLAIKAEIKWDNTAWSWVQSYFSINGTEGGGTVEGTFNGATFDFRFVITSSYCTPADVDVTYKAPVYVDDSCRSIIGRRAGPATGWPTTLTAKCVDCTPNTTTTESTTESTSSSTTESTTESTTASTTTTTGSTTDSTTTTTTTTGSTTDSTTTTTTTTGSTTDSTTTTTTTTGSTPPPCSGNCNWIGVVDSVCGSPTGFAWSGNGNTCSGCSSPPCSTQSCSDLATYLGRWPSSDVDAITHACI